MNTGQMILTIGGLMLLSTIILRLNTTHINSATAMYNSKFDNMAVPLANSYIELIKRKAFDHNSFEAAVNSTAKLSTVLGKEPGETRSTFNDVDDFNNDSLYQSIDLDDSTDIYKLKCKVQYYDAAAGKVSSTPKFHKKITVTVTNEFMTDSLTLSTIFSYWKFR
ncbi:MAG: hypothetical protein R6W90_07185 [Ignavibacteriaceae bacterium]